MSNKYVAALDGIRAVAILLVMLVHLQLFLFGWVGVQMFFVLSGFLITRILLAQKDQPLKTFLRNFYIRRILRIFPIYFGLLIVVSLIFLISKSPAGFDQEAPYLYTYTWNFANLQPDFTGSGLFGHFWSLCVEEQFYLVWPFLIYVTPRKYLPALLIAIIVVVPGLRFVSEQYLLLHDQSLLIGIWSRDIPILNFDAFAMGAAVTVFDFPAKIKRPGWWTIGLILASIAIGLVTAYLGSGKWRPLTLGYPQPSTALLTGYQTTWRYSLIDLWSVCLLVYALYGRNASRVLGNRFLASIGKVSYGMYLFHLPLLYLTLLNPDLHIPYVPRSWQGIAMAVAFALVVYLISLASYYLFEVKFLALKDRLAPETPAPHMTETPA